MFSTASTSERIMQLFALVLLLAASDHSGLKSGITPYFSEAACIEASKALELTPFDGMARCVAL
jgi:hypothetical protein